MTRRWSVKIIYIFTVSNNSLDISMFAYSTCQHSLKTNMNEPSLKYSNLSRLQNKRTDVRNQKCVWVTHHEEKEKKKLYVHMYFIKTRPKIKR